MKNLRLGYKILLVILIIFLGWKITTGIIGNKDNNVGEKSTILNEFDVNYSWEKEGIDTKEVFKGSYDITHENGINQMWIGKEAEINLDFTKEFKFLNLKGWIPYELHKKSNEELNEVEIKVFIDETEVNKFVFTEDKEFDLNIPYDEIKEIAGNNEKFNLKLKINNTFNPSKLGVNDDARDLSIIINYAGEK